VNSGFEKSWLDNEGFYWLNWMQAKHYMRFDTAPHLEAWKGYIMLLGPRQWNGRNPYQKHILEKRGEIQARLSEILQLKTSSLEGSIHGSRQIHQAMRQHIFSDEFINAMFLPLTIYLGDLYIQLKKGSWIIKYDDSIDNWIPLIQMENGRIFDIGTEVYYDLLGDEEETDYFPPLIEVFRRAM